MYEKTISIIGSWRPTEQENDRDTKDRFIAISKELGVLACREGYVLRVIWSNDHLDQQCSPILRADGGSPLHMQPDGLFSASPRDVRYLFEDTADYHALVGYLEEAERTHRVDAQVELMISDQMWNGSTEPRTVAWCPIRVRTINGQSFEDFVRRGSIKIVPIDGALKEKPYLRSLQLRDLVKGESPVDAVIVLGGGKATQLLCDIAGALNKLIPLPYCGSKGLEALKEAYREPTSELYQRLVLVFGPSLDPDNTYLTTGAAEIRLLLKAAIRGFLSRPGAQKPVAQSNKYDLQ